MAELLESDIELEYGFGSDMVQTASMAVSGSATSLVKDAIHQELKPTHVSPAQLYSTESGRLFHAGKLCIVLVGLPARGKTHLAVSLTRYLRWLGVKTHAFHLSDYRRRIIGDEQLPEDYFSSAPRATTAALRQQLLDSCVNDMMDFYSGAVHGQVAIFDAVNATTSSRRQLADVFRTRGIKPLFIELLCTDTQILAKNIRLASNSPDYIGWPAEKAVVDYLRRIEVNRDVYEEMDESELSYIKMINFGERIIVNNSQFGYLWNRIVFFLMNARIKTGYVYFARAGPSTMRKPTYKDDPPLSEAGDAYSQILADTLLRHIANRRATQEKKELQDNIDTSVFEQYKDTTKVGPDQSLSHEFASRQRASGNEGIDEDSIVVWTSTRVRTLQTAKYFRAKGIPVRQRSQLTQLHPGDVENMTVEEIREKLGEEELERHMQDPYHHRYPRSESYHDLAVRMEPLILEMERMRGDILVIAHESVLRVLYGYLMASSIANIPFLKFPRNEVVEISYSAYANVARRIRLDGVEP